ncbi:DNA-binding transcriptional LysR family regulator [Janthinobacterium sp. CG_23.3]|uniref:LysR family transcriptional regulator n=1 Tax=Janthinobacterium sp. CG_23.3 TaxID=3349634 RepID=UPI0038D3F22B
MNRVLKTFIAAAKASSFSIAGSTLGLTQPAISSQMKKLEEDLNCQLFDRMGKAVVLSARGRQLLPTAQEIVRLYDTMKGQSTDADVAGRLDLGAITTVQMGLLPEALWMFRQQFAGVEVNVVPGTSVQLLSQIDARELDFAVMIKPSLKLPKDLRWTPLLKENYVAIAHSRVAYQPVRELLRTHPFIRYNRRSYGGQLVDRFLKRNRIQVNDVMELDEPAVILQMVRSGLGVSIVPYELVADQLGARIRIYPLKDSHFYREIGILQRINGSENKVLDALVDSLAAISSSKAVSGASALDILVKKDGRAD